MAKEQEQSIIWNRLDRPGHEYARVFFEQSRGHLSGTAIFVYEKEFCRLDYSVECDSEWKTLAGKVAGYVGDKIIKTAITADSKHHWRPNGRECPDVENCTDIDLNFSPVTNLLPVRRLNLAVGEKAAVRAAWLRFPSFALEPLEQIYERVDKTKYRYESAGGQFVTELLVNDFGLVTEYPNFWQVENR